MTICSIFSVPVETYVGSLVGRPWPPQPPCRHIFSVGPKHPSSSKKCYCLLGACECNRVLLNKLTDADPAHGLMINRTKPLYRHTSCIVGHRKSQSAGDLFCRARRSSAPFPLHTCAEQICVSTISGQICHQSFPSKNLYVLTLIFYCVVCGSGIFRVGNSTSSDIPRPQVK